MGDGLNATILHFLYLGATGRHTLSILVLVRELSGAGVLQLMGAPKPRCL